MYVRFYIFILHIAIINCYKFLFFIKRLNYFLFYISGIEEDEKEFLRQRLISNFEEPVNQLALQLAVLIAKIAR